MLWQDHTWPELADAARKGYLVVQPCGSTEQHGKHLPVDTDSAIVFEVAQRAADEVGRTLVLPCLHYGLSSHHLDFPGTVSLSLETYTTLFRDIARCVAHHGFKILILLNGHGGNTAALWALAIIPSGPKGVPGKTVLVRSAAQDWSPCTFLLGVSCWSTTK